LHKNKHITDQKL